MASAAARAPAVEPLLLILVLIQEQVLDNLFLSTRFRDSTAAY